MIYILKANVYTKIGVTDVSIEKRITQLQTGNPFKIEKVFAKDSISSKTCYDMEKYLHRKFINKRLYGEWFILDKKDIQSAIKYINNRVSKLKKDEAERKRFCSKPKEWIQCREVEMWTTYEKNKDKLKDIPIRKIEKYIKATAKGGK